jgi:hypothetical protein
MAAAANDTTAVLSTGGLEFVTNESIVMQSEELFISKEEIRVVYEFRNTGSEDQDILVAFPMPELVPNFYSPVGFPEGPADNLFEFETTINGVPVEAELHEYAFALGVDRTKLLKQMGLPVVPISSEALEATDALGEAEQARLLHLGMLSIDEYDTGEGPERHYYPHWSYRASYTWEGHFPADETVTVEHRYKPSVGGTVAFSGLAEGSDDYDPREQYQKYCLDESFLAAVRKTLTDPDDPYSAPFVETWLSYILTTGGNWGGGSIERFRLVVDKGDADNLVSFCGDNVKKIGPTTFEMVEEGFWPDRELEILILERRDW